VRYATHPSFQIVRKGSIADMAHFAEMNSIWDAWMPPGNSPARATVEAPDYEVEIMMVAAR
jgi:enamine deaminase RidA (YjgF/YER057c/UK114 family)